jgi:hypothetical protein
VKALHHEVDVGGGLEVRVVPEGCRGAEHGRPSLASRKEDRAKGRRQRNERLQGGRCLEQLLVMDELLEETGLKGLEGGLVR